MVKVEKHCRMEEVEKPMSTSYWMRTYKPTVDYLRDTPFALDRQLEDQKFLQNLNRNPQLNVPTKVDLAKTHHQAPSGNVRAVAMKATAVNKIVREATGIHNFTIVAPPRAISNEKGLARELLDPETNPRVRSYAAESKQKPVLCSFGHRPSSASRTFHPATMKFRLPHGAIAPITDAHRTSVGLPVAVLKKVIKAPPIIDVMAEAQKASAPTSPAGDGSPFSSKPHSPGVSPSRPPLGKPAFSDLFLSKTEQDSLFSLPSKGGGGGAGDMSSRSHASSKRRSSQSLQPLGQRSQASWVSGSHGDEAPDPFKPPVDDRPTWNEGFHRIERPSNHVFQLRASGLQTKSAAPLSELIHRFSAMSVAENQLHPFCTEKQELDKLARSGAVPEVPKSVPVRGQPLYYDPLDVEVAALKRHRRKVERDKERQRKVAAYKMSLRAIPDVDYYPTTQLAALRSQSSSALATTSSSGGLDATAAGTGPGQVGAQGDSGSADYDAQFPGWRELEREMKASLRAARKGDLDVLYDSSIAQHLGEQTRR